MYDYLIIHGSYGSPFENWFPWLFNKLEQEGKKVLAPQFPTISQNYDNWNSVMQTYDKYIDNNTSIIAHSLGPAFIIDYLYEHKKSVKNLFLVAPFYGLINIADFDFVNKTFFVLSDLTKANEYFHSAWCIFSDNDPYVPISLSKNFSGALNATELIITGGGHLNSSAGYTTFKELWDVIKKNE